MRRMVSHGCSFSHSPGKPPRMTSGARRAKRGRGQRVGLDQQRQALDGGEAADVQDHRAVGGEPAQVLVPVADGAGRLAGRPAARLAHEVLVPELEPVDVAGLEDLRVEAVRDDDAAPRVDAEDALGPVDVRGREDDQPLAAPRPALHPLPPGLEVGPAAGRLLEHEELRAVEVADDRHVGRDPLRRGVERREVVEVEDVVIGRAGFLEDVRPGVDLVLVGGVAECGEDAVGRALAVLVGPVHRRVGGHRVGGAGRCRHVDGDDVQALVELARVAGRLARARDDAHLPAGGGQRAREVVRHVGRTAPGEEGQAHQHAFAHRPVDPSLRRRTSAPAGWAVGRGRSAVASTSGPGAHRRPSRRWHHMDTSTSGRRLLSAGSRR